MHQTYIPTEAMSIDEVHNPFTVVVCGGGNASQARLAGLKASGRSIRATYYTPEIPKVKFRWNMSLKVHWTIPVKVHWTSDNPLEHTTDKWICVGKYH